jgi:hypothetical protein
VIERVRAYEARVGQTVEVEDEKLRGSQRVAFSPSADAAQVTLELEYELKEAQRPDAPHRRAVHPARAARLAQALAGPLRARAPRGHRHGLLIRAHICRCTM